MKTDQSYEVVIPIEKKLDFLHDFYQLSDAFVLYETMVDMHSDKLTITLCEDDLTYLLLKHNIKMFTLHAPSIFQDTRYLDSIFSSHMH